MRINKKTALTVLGLSATLLGGNALAVAYDTTLTGTTVSYAFNSADLGYFGTAAVSGDDLVFTPTSFMASSTNGIFTPGAAAIQTLWIAVSANSGYQLSAFNLAESGGYSISAAGATASVTGNLTALDIEGTNSQVIGDLTSSSLSVVGAPANWTANAGVVLPATGWGGTDGVVNSISLQITNQLFATSIADSTAQIWKNAVGVHTVTSPVPEADAYAMMLAGLGLVGFMARRARTIV
ncbi:MAG: PEP-CTERM sorting domain-containing protein [Thiobacillus sp.]